MTVSTVYENNTLEIVQCSPLSVWVRTKLGHFALNYTMLMHQNRAKTQEYMLHKSEVIML